MSTPPFLRLPKGVRRVDVKTSRGVFAALEAATPKTKRSALGRPVLMIPGYTGSKEDFIAVLRPLRQAGRHTLAIDMRGQYETPGPDDPAAYTTRELAGDALAILDELGDDPVDIVGHSFGGLVARQTVLSDPSRARSLSLLSSGPAAVDGERAEHARLLVAVLRELGIEAVWDGMEALAAQDPAAANRPPAVVSFLRKRLFMNSKAGLIAMSDALLGEPDRVEELAATKVPTMVMYGDADDTWAPAVQAEMAERLAARHVVITGSGHSPAAEAPDATVKGLLDFWSSA